MTRSSVGIHDVLEDTIKHAWRRLKCPLLSRLCLRLVLFSYSFRSPTMSIGTLLGLTERILTRLRQLYANLEIVPLGSNPEEKRTDITWETKRNLDLLLLFKQERKAPTDIELDLCAIIDDIENLARSIIGKSGSTVDEKLPGADVLHPALVKYLEAGGSLTEGGPFSVSKPCLDLSRAS